MSTKEITAEMTEADVVNAALAAAELEEAPPAQVEDPAPAEEAEPTDPPPPAEDAPPAEDPAPEEPTPEEVPPEEPPPAEELTEEQKANQEADEAAKAIGIRSERSTEKFREVYNDAKKVLPAVRAELEQVRPAAERWEHTMRFVQEHNISPEMYGQAMNMMAGLASNDLGVLEKVAGALEAELQRVNQRLGREGAGFDPLSTPENHDLRMRVETGEIDRSAALEIGRLRHANSHNEQVRAEQQRRQQEADSAAEARNQAVAELDRLGEELSKLDPNFAAKSAAIEPSMKAMIARLPPREWAAAYKEAYMGFQYTPPPAARAAPAPTPLRHQPLRPSAVPGGAAAAPVQTEADVVAEALRQAAALDGVPFKG